MQRQLQLLELMKDQPVPFEDAQLVMEEMGREAAVGMEIPLNGDLFQDFQDF